MKSSRLIIPVIFLLLIPAHSYSQDLFTTLAFETRYLRGDSTYHISFDDPWVNGGHGESELEFPVDVFLRGLHLVVGGRNENNPQLSKGRLHFTWMGSPKCDAGIMKDSDWIENDTAYGEPLHAGRDLYTESDSDMEATHLDVGYGHFFSLSNRWAIGPKIGYRYQEFEYDIFGARGAYWSTPVSIQGRVIRYWVEYKMPYVGVTSEYIFGNEGRFRAVGSIAYSDWVKATDRDDHVMRSKLSESQCKGNAYWVNLNLDWNFYKKWILGIGGEYAQIDTNGRQFQHYYAGPFVGTSFEVNNDISSSYWSSLIRISYTWNSTP